MRNRRPAWWQLLLLVPAMLILGALEHADPVPGISETIVDAVIIILTFIGMLAWVHANEGLIEHYEVDKDGWLRSTQITVYRPAHEKRAEQETRTEGEIPALDSIVRRRRQSVLTGEDKDKWSPN